MLTSTLDHLVVVAPSLAVGIAYVRHALGATPQPGGKHPRMGTHNALLKLGEQMFLEVIAIDPDAPGPDRPRWFELDQLRPDDTPRLATWVARTNDIQSAVAASPVAFGSIEPMSRGALNWAITIPPDGSLPLHGIAPTLIEWHNGPHPANGLQDQGCSLVSLEGSYPQADTVSGMLRSIGFQGDFPVHSLPAGAQPSLAAQIQTPNGVRILRGA